MAPPVNHNRECYNARHLKTMAGWSFYLQTLPVSVVLPQLLKALQQSRQVLLAAPTGAGKSTWLPLQILHQAEWHGRILLLEPRRLAARNVAQRLAEGLNQSPGKTVGYRMRAESCTGPDTRIEVVTEGILTRMLQQDPMLEGIDLVILDEFHERSLQADLALALLLDVQQGLRDDLKILLMSATLDNERLQRLLPDAPYIVSEGRSFPVERRYRALAVHRPIDEAITREVVQLLREESGSLLLFLPGIGEIERIKERLAAQVGNNVDLCPLYGGLSLEKQRLAIQPAQSGRRKVVLATNIAETSLTIDGIRLVVDCALERVACFDVRSGLTRLQTQRTSQASMTQRAGRAGRLAPGVCLHLLSREQADRASAQRDAEIMHSELASLWMELLQWGCHNAQQLHWLDTPPMAASDAARRLLVLLGAVDEQGRLTDKGRRMAQTGCDPRYATLLVNAGRDHAAVATAARLVAILEDPDRHRGSDLRDSFFYAQPRWQCRENQLKRRLGVTGGEAVIGEADRLLAQAFPDRIARLRGADGRYQLANGSGASLDPSSALNRHEWLIIPSLLQRENQPDARILQAMPLDIEKVMARCPSLVHHVSAMKWHEERGTLRMWRHQMIGSLVLKSYPLDRPERPVLHAAMLQWIRENGLSVLNWTPEAEQLRIRMYCAAGWLPEHDWPEVDESTLLGSLESWLLPEMSGVKDMKGLRQVSLCGALLTRLSWAQRRQLDRDLPTHYVVPTGSRLLIRYDKENPPILAVRIQEMFGEATTPCIAGGRVPLVLELLSPAQRPLQITRDLAAFWQGAWSQVQKEMRGRYPKHLWPDDPAHTLPTRRTKRFSGTSDQ